MQEAAAAAGRAGGKPARPLKTPAPSLAHFCQHVAHDLAVVVLRHVQQLGPGEHMVEVILQQGEEGAWVSTADLAHRIPKRMGQSAPAAAP
jgi:hypothetical protein